MKFKLFSVFLLLIGFQAQATIMTFTDRTAFQAAAGSLTLEDFNDSVFDTGFGLAVGGSYQLLSSSLSCPNASQCQYLIESASLTLSFAPGVKAVGFDYNELNLSSLDYVDSAGHTINSALTANSYLEGSWQPEFFGVISDVDLDWLTIGSGLDSGGAIYFIDDVEFSSVTVPEPSVVVLLSLGLLGMVFAKRKNA